MSMSDPIADMLTRVRNGQMAKKEFVAVPASKMKKSILDVLKGEGYIMGYTEDKDDAGHPVLNVELKYHNGAGVISEVKRMSRPGLRAYSGTHDIPMIRNGLGVVIVSTSQGVMTDMQAKDLNIGGELICSVF